MAVAAPAFAVSPASTPEIVPGASCKCPGSGANNFDFKAVLSVTTAGNASWTFHIVSWTFDGIAGPIPADVTLTGGDGNLILTINRTNSASKHNVGATIQATNLQTSEVVTFVFPATELSFPPVCVAPVPC